MKPISMLAAALWCAGRLYGQPVPAQVAYPVTTTVVPDSSGSSLIRVRNNGAVDLTGFLFIYTLHRAVNGPAYGASTGYYDSVTDAYAHAVPPGQEVLLPLRVGGNGFSVTVSVGAGIFADGTSFGENATIQRIVDRRNYMLVSLNKSIAELIQSSKEGSTREQMIAQFQTALNEEMAVALNPDVAGCIQAIRGQVLANLRGAREPDGSVPPVQTLIDSLLKSLRSRRDLIKKALA